MTPTLPTTINDIDNEPELLSAPLQSPILPEVIGVQEMEMTTVQIHTTPLVEVLQEMELTTVQIHAAPNDEMETFL